jgi:hypothetical protein
MTGPWAQTIEVAVGQGVIAADPGSAVYRTDLATAAVAALEEEGLDTLGMDSRRLRSPSGGN